MKKLLFAFIALAFVFNACNQKKFVKSEEGFEYMMVEDEDTKAPTDGNMLIYDVAYYDEKDSLLFSSKEKGQPVIVKYGEQRWDESGPFFKALKLLTPGDSAVIKMTASDFYTMSMRAPLPESMTTTSPIFIHLRFEEEMDEEGFQEWQLDKQETRKQEELKKIDDYLAENNIEAQIDEASGIRYVVTEKGEGTQPQAGDSVVVNYRGKLLDGTQFDSSFEREEPFTFQLGMGRVIPGWDKGIPLYNVGGKGTIYIPSTMGYGQRGAGGVIPPNSILVFDIEVLDVIESSNN